MSWGVSGYHRAVWLPRWPSPEKKDWSGGSRVAFHVASRSTGRDQWILDVEGDAERRTLLDARYSEWGGRFSSDRGWIAFVSIESGCTEVYLALVDDPGARTVIWSGGGASHRWRGDGREIDFLGPGSGIGSGAWIHPVEIRTQPSPDLSEPRVLFEVDGPVHETSYDVVSDGSALLANHSIDAAARRCA